MKRIIALTMLAACACDREPQQNAAMPATADVTAIGMAKDEKKSEAPLVLPMPKDQAEVDRLILAGYTPHGEHLHLPDVSKCPLADGKEAIM